MFEKTEIVDKRVYDPMSVANKLCASFPTDTIAIPESSIDTMLEARRAICGEEIPLDDVIRGGMTPLTDFIVELGDSRNQLRFCVFSDAIHHMNTVALDNEHVAVAAVQHCQSGIFNTLTMKPSDIPGMRTIWYEANGHKIAGESPFEEVNEAWALFTTVQILLLHPQTKDIFSSVTIQKERRRNRDQNGKRKRITWYIKKHIVDDTPAKKSLNEIQRHCQCWFVLGHWRQYKSGKKVFIKGYWKGPMRHMQRNLDDGRLRRIV